MNLPETRAAYACPKCAAEYDRERVGQSGYRCPQCGFELAHIDTAPNGAVRGTFGWLKSVGDIVEERYRIVTVLGKGGFGATYLVEDLRLNGRRRALKEVPELLFDEYETQLLSHLSHPSIPDIIDRSKADGMVYLVLEFGGSRTLSTESDRLGRKIPLHRTLSWMRQLCEVLHYLHSQSPPIIHRDLKPDNVLLDDNDRIMLIDFGIAKESAPSTMTRALGRAASPGFSPPEQALGTGTDQRSDIYALGATVYYLLTGQVPPGAHERLAGKEVPAPSQLAADIPAELDQAIILSLSLNPNQRQQAVTAFIEMLDGLDTRARVEVSDVFRTSKTTLVGQAGPLAGTTGPVRPSIKIPAVLTTGPTPATPLPPPPRRRRRGLTLALVAMVLGAAAGGAYLYWRSVTKSEGEEAAVAVPGPTEPSMPAAPTVAPPLESPTAPASAVPPSGGEPRREAPAAEAPAAPILAPPLGPPTAPAPSVPPSGGETRPAAPAAEAPAAPPPEAPTIAPTVPSPPSSVAPAAIEPAPATTEPVQPSGAGIATRIVDERRKAQSEDAADDRIGPADAQPAKADDKPPATAAEPAPASRKRTVTPKTQTAERSRQRDASPSPPASSGWKITPDQGRKLD